MFSPPGWLLPWQVEALCDEAAKLVHWTYAVKSTSEPIPTSNLLRSRALMGDFLFCGILSTHGAHICSPTSTVLGIGGALIHLEGSPFDYKWTFPHAEGSGLARIFEKYIQSPDYSALAEFDFIDITTGTINASPDRIVAIIQNGSERDEDLRLATEVARNFHGWAICFDPEVVPEDPDTLLLELGLVAEASAVREHLKVLVSSNETMEEDSATPTTRIQRKALAAFWQAFPDGRGDATWPEIAKRTGYSKTTLWRAFRAAGIP